MHDNGIKQFDEGFCNNEGPAFALFHLLGESFFVVRLQESQDSEKAKAFPMNATGLGWAAVPQHNELPRASNRPIQVYQEREAKNINNDY